MTTAPQPIRWLRGRAAAVAAAALLLALVAGGCAALRPTLPTDDLSTWSPVPLAPDPQLTTQIGPRCGTSDAGPVTVLLQDQRTRFTAAFLFTAGAFHGVCYVTSASGGAGGGSGNNPLPAMTGPIAIDENGSGGVADGSASVLGGRVAPNVSEVRLSLDDGRVATASIGSGHWLVWWPGGPAAAKKLVAFAADGTVLVSIDDPKATG